MKYKIHKYFDSFLTTGKLFYIILAIYILSIFVILLISKPSSYHHALKGNPIVIPIQLISHRKPLYTRKLTSRNLSSEIKDHIQEQSNQTHQGSEGQLQNHYIAQILKKIESNKQYPGIELMMEREGFVKLKITIDKSGKLKSITIIEGSNQNFIQEAIHSVRRSSPFPPFPSSFSKNELDIVLNLKFLLE